MARMPSSHPMSQASRCSPPFYATTGLVPFPCPHPLPRPPAQMRPRCTLKSTAKTLYARLPHCIVFVPHAISLLTHSRFSYARALISPLGLLHASCWLIRLFFRIRPPPCRTSSSNCLRPSWVHTSPAPATSLPHPLQHHLPCHHPLTLHLTPTILMTTMNCCQPRSRTATTTYMTRRKISNASLTTAEMIRLLKSWPTSNSPWRKNPSLTATALCSACELRPS